MKAAEILHQLRRVYATAPAYRDRGRVIFAKGAADRDRRIVGEFETTFVRLRGFAFEYREIPAPNRLRDPSARRRLATGITFGAAHCAIRLLLPEEIEGRALSDAPSAQVLGTELVDGKSCFVLRLEQWSASEIAVEERFVLRRVISARSTDAATGIAHARVLTYEAELPADEPADASNLAP